MPLSAAGNPIGGLLLVRASPEKIVSWVSRGVVAAHVTPLGDWTAVTVAERRGRAIAPYDDARTALVARPLSTNLRPAIGFFAAGRRGVIVLQSPGWRAVQRWVVWSPGVGVVRSPRLPAARPRDLAALAGIGASGVPRLLGALREAHAGPLGWLGGVHTALALPGRALLTDPDAPRGLLVEPGPDSLARFDAMMREHAAHLAEVAPPTPRPGGRS